MIQYLNRLLATLFLLTLLNSCSKSVTKDEPIDVIEEEVIEISEFYFDRANNPSLTEDLRLEEDKGVYSAEIPKYYSKNLIPTFKTNAIKVLVNNIAQESGVTSRDFSQEVTYTFIGAKGSNTNVIIRLNWVNFEIPQFNIQIEGNQEVIDKEKYLKATVSIDGNILYSNFEAPTEIRGRGNSTWTYPKKPYRIRLTNKASILGLTEARNWVLLANYLDPSLMCNAVAMRIGRDLNVPFTNDIIPVDVTINGTYRGSYVLTQHLEVAENRINLTKSGYLFELDTYYDEEYKFKSVNYNLPVMIKSPELSNQNEIIPIKEDFQQLENLIFNSSFPNNGYREKFNIDVFARYIIVYLLTSNQELNHPKSTYLHKSTNEKYAFGPIWDFDWAFGYSNGGSHFVDPMRPFFRDNTIGKIFFTRLLTDPQTQKLVKSYWQAYKSNKFNNLMKFIDEYAALIKDSKAKDELVWNKGKNFEQEVLRLKSYLDARKNYIDTFVSTY